MSVDCFHIDFLHYVHFCFSTQTLGSLRFPRKLGLTKGLEAALQQRKIACCVYDETVPNPTIDNVEAARALYLANGAQAIIAFGGGSSMDCAKAAAASNISQRSSLLVE